MAWVTTIGPDMAQIEYRLDANTGCSLSADDDQIEYRMDADRPLEWIGDGLREVGIEPGTVLDEHAKDAARALADGADPRTGEVLVSPKLAVDPRAKLPARPLLDAVTAAAAAANVTPAKLLAIDSRAAARLARLTRGVAGERVDRDGTVVLEHRVPVNDLARIAKAAGVDLVDVYDPEQLATARKYAGARVVVGNRGYDITFNIGKSYSALSAMAPPELAAQLEDVYLDAVRDAMRAMEGWAGYGMRGHHGDGQRAERVDGTGMLGWMTVHRTARPTPGAAPDPHLHAHVTVLNLVRGVDGQWSTVGAGGRDIHRHAHAADELVKARLRQVTRERWGVQWARDPRNGEWEIVGVPDELRAALSKRGAQVSAALRDEGLDPDAATVKQAQLAAAQTREAKLRPSPAGGPGGGAGDAELDLRGEWQRQARAIGVDPDEVVAAAMPGPGPDSGVAPGGPPTGPQPTTPEVAAAWVWRAEDGLTAHRKTTTRADVLAAVMDSMAEGVDRLADAEQLVDAVLQLPDAVPLPAAGAVHLSNHQRYTSADVVNAERTVLAAAADRYGAGLAVVDERVLQLAVGQFEATSGFSLTDEQRAVLARLAGDGHGVDAVIGVAGAGKTTIMAAYRAALEAAGLTVAGASTAAVAAQQLQTESGIEARTVASWLWRIDNAPDGRGLAGVDVLVVDEAAMVDDRHMARLLQAAGATGTKVVGIGDPLQLRSPGIGGTFAAVHQLVDGLNLTDNRRQRDVDERAALAMWREDERRGALHRWADADRVHVTDTPAEAHAEMLQVWATERQRWADPHDRAAQLLMLAHRNVDVDALNAAARQIRVDAGELPGAEHTYQLRDGRQLTVGVGDQVLLRTNERRPGGVDVLNGYRGVVLDVDDAGRTRVQWRRTGPDGEQLVDAWLTPAYIADGGLQLGYAMTAAKAQGLTAERGLVYGGGMDAHVLYPAMSRDRERADLWLARTLLEDPADDVRQGPPATPAEALHRTITAYATQLERDRPDGLVLDELGEPIPTRPTQPTGPAEPREPAEPRGPAAAVALARQADPDPEQPLPASLAERAAMAERLAAVRLAFPPRPRPQPQPVETPAAGSWRTRPHGGVLDAELPAAIVAAERGAAAKTAAAARSAEVAQALLEQTRAGRGPAANELAGERNELRQAAAAADRAAQAYTAVTQAEAAYRAADDEVRRLQQQSSGSNWLQLRMQGTSRAELREQIDAARAAVLDAAGGVGKARGDYNDLVGRAERAARQPVVARYTRGRRHVADALAELETSWPERHAQAVDVDMGRVERAARRADELRAEAGQLTTRGAQLRAEAALRAELPPGTAVAEETGRGIARTAERLRQIRQENQQRRENALRPAHRPPHAGPGYDYVNHPTHEPRGPSLGL